MADNVTLGVMSGGSVVAADDIGSGVLAQRVKPVWGPDGTGTDVDVASGLPVQSGWKTLTGSASANTTDLINADVAGYRTAYIQLTGTYTGVNVSFEVSNDQTNWTGVYAWYLSTTTGGAVTSGSVANGTYQVPLSGRYLRVRTFNYTSGTVTATAHLVATPVPMGQVQPFSGATFTVTGGSASTDGQSGGTSFAAQGAVYNGSTWDRLRVPTTFKSVSTQASGSTALWTPGASKKFRLMRFKIDVTQDAAQSSGGDITVDLLDSATAMGVAQSVFVPGTAATTMGPGWTSGWIDLGNGKLSSTINQVLNVSLSAALTSGSVRVIACGVEE